jgi:hypothetical protein
MPNLSNGILTNQGGVPSGYYDPLADKYWTYVHSNISGNTVIRQAIHSDFNIQVNTFNTVISGPIIGEPSTTKTESPGFCVNDFLTASFSEIANSSFSVYPNPAYDRISVRINANLIGSSYTINDPEGRIIIAGQIISMLTNINISEFAAGVYLFKLAGMNGQSFMVMKK